LYRPDGNLLIEEGRIRQKKRYRKRGASHLGNGMNRRTFLLKSLFWTLSSTVGLSPFANARAMGRHPREARMAIIIDDIGYSRRRAASFLDINANLTFAILPHLPYSVELARRIHAQGHEILLHQPMEPYDGHLDPGPGALFVGDSAPHIENVLATNIKAVPFAKGVNNHMGSRFTSNGEEIRYALKAIKRRGLFFIDSLTSHHSKAYRTACGLHMTSGRRDTFLDNDRCPQTILNHLYNAMNRALVYGHAIAIGHPYPETAAALRLFWSEVQDTPLCLTPVSRLLSKSA